MVHNLARETLARQEDPAGSLAIDLLAYAAMGDDAALERRTLEASGADLGCAVLMWYHMCEAMHGVETTATLARKTAQGFYDGMHALQEGPEFDQQYIKDRAVGLSMARGLLIDLATDQTERFGELWAVVVSTYSTPVILETVAALLGFSRGVLDNRTADQ